MGNSSEITFGVVDVECIGCLFDTETPLVAIIIAQA